MIHFSSPATADVVMFDDQGRSLIELMGHLWSPRGAIAADDVNAALETLRHGLAGRGLDAPDPEAAAADDEDGKQVIELQRRAFPLMAMLEAAAGKHAPVLWRQ
jgi:hypothetical protein